MLLESNTSNSSKPRFLVRDIDPILCPPYVYGFSLEMKEWCKFFVDNLTAVEWRDNPMDALILEDSKRRLVKALVSTHRYPENARNEAQAKGKGLIILLHGTPGSGKTLTAGKHLLFLPLFKM